MTSLQTSFQKYPDLSPRRTCIITNSDNQEALDFAEQVSHWLQEKDISVAINQITPDQDIIIVLGGDGTLLHIAEQAARYSIPVIGINLGHLGFLTELTKTEAISSLETILANDIIVENRLMLKASLQQQSNVAVMGYALNDIVINKDANDRILYLSVQADGNLITTYKADGLIFSTPTGSTAYNLSSGGPLVFPGLASILVTPICPFMLSSRPILLPATVTLRTSFDPPNFRKEANIIIDGQKSVMMHEHDTLLIQPAEHPLQLIIPPHRDYFAILRNKLHWGVTKSE